MSLFYRKTMSSNNLTTGPGLDTTRVYLLYGCPVDGTVAKC